MTILVLTLVAICLVGGAWATVAEHIARKRERRCAHVEHTHVRVVQTPYDWKELDSEGPVLP